ncbi:probable G-protein coupled receptor 139 [Narcine bancroftii]|uniref:probable G-protein coupled receptor 139 n=1 Tax=Narcine bancroftii TaxID=1343680 RepID=UPI0038322015
MINGITFNTVSSLLASSPSAREREAESLQINGESVDLPPALPHPLHRIFRSPVPSIQILLIDTSFAANLAAIAILLRGKCGLSKCISYYLVAMAVTDLVVIITAVILNRTVNMYFPLSILSITPVCKLIFVLIFASRDCSVWVTVMFTFDRYIAICCQKLKTAYCTERTAATVIGIVCAVSCMMNVPWYFTFTSAYVINGVPWLCEGALAFDIYPAWATYDWIHRILTPCLPFFLILLLNVLTVRHILAANRTRRRLLKNRNGDNQSDPEAECRRKSIVLLLLISCCFILSWLLIFIKMIYLRIEKMPYFSGSNFKDPRFILEESGYMLQLLSSCINPFIYAGTQKKIREQLKNGLKYPLTLFVRLFK